MNRLISLSFVDDLGSIASGISAKEIARIVDTVATTVLEPGIANAVTCDTSEKEAVIFSRFHRQILSKQLREIKIKVGNEKTMSNKEATRWLGVWPDVELKFTSQINEGMRRARTAKIQIKGLTRTHELVPRLVRRIQHAVVQSTALYNVEL